MGTHWRRRLWAYVGVAVVSAVLAAPTSAAAANGGRDDSGRGDGGRGDGGATAAPTQLAYVLDPLDAAVSVINTETNAVIHRERLGLDPVALAVSPDGTRVYILTHGTQCQCGSVDVYSTVSWRRLSITSLPSPPANGMALTPDGTTLWISGGPMLMDTSTNAVTRLRIVRSPGGPVAVSQDGTRVYISGSATTGTGAFNAVNKTFIKAYNSAVPARESR